MCGRYTLFSEADNPELLGIIREIERKYGPGAVSAGEVFPSGRAPILIAAEGRTCPELGTWGFPRPGTGGLVINARAETAAEKRMFSESLLRRRCAVPCAGFYEWDAAKTKYLFPDRTTSPFPPGRRSPASTLRACTANSAACAGMWC